MTSSNKQTIFLLLAISGICSTWYFNIQFMLENGTDIRDFIAATSVNDAARSIGVDITIFGLAFFFWSFHEAKKLGMKNWWLYVVLSCGIAIAFGAPLFLYMREKKLAELSQDSPG